MYTARSRIPTAAGGRLMTASYGAATPFNTNAIQVNEGEYTRVIYTLIKEGNYADAIPILENKMMQFTESRAAKSLLAYCHYHSENYTEAARYYGQLVELCPEEEQYKLYHAQSLYKDCAYKEAITKTQTLTENEENYDTIEKLQAYCNYEMNELAQTKKHASNLVETDPDAMVIEGCVLFKEGNYNDARKKFQEALRILGYKANIAYNIALCFYFMKQYTKSLKYIQEIIKRGITEHPELAVGAQHDGYDVRSVGNTQVLKDTALIEAFNLKYAIEYVMKNMEGAEDALKDMPPRTEEQLDAVTLHNQGLLQMETEATKGFKKLKHLIQNPPFPEETFANLLILYCKYHHYSLAADVIAENRHLVYHYMTKDLYDFITALIESQTSPEEAYQKFDILTSKHIDNLRRLTKQIQDARIDRSQELIKKGLKEYDEALSQYIPVLMSMARIYWDRKNYSEVERILMQSSEFCSENDVWKLNMAHVYFMQESDKKFEEAIKLYEALVNKQRIQLLEIPAMVLANLCVSYIMTTQNEKAEEWMKNIETVEQEARRQDPNKSILHLCIVNLVIGTLYCSKGGISHYEFGISRVIKSLEPYKQRLMADTWVYSKRCFLALIETLAKHMIMIKDQTFVEILKFLDAAILYGKDIPAIADFVSDNKSGGDFANMYESGFNPNLEVDKIPKEELNVAYEARLLKMMFLRLQEGK